MSWDQKPGGTSYYYRTVRAGKMTRKIYFGKGPLAERAARLDAEVRQRRQAAREAFLAEQARLAQADLALREFGGLVDQLTRAALLLAGYHQHHHGEWRRRRYFMGEQQGAVLARPAPGEGPGAAQAARPQRGRQARAPRNNPRSGQRPAPAPRPPSARMPDRDEMPPPEGAEHTRHGPPVPAQAPTPAEALMALTRRANAGSATALEALREFLDARPEVWSAVGDVGRLAQAAWLALIAAENKLLEESAKRHLAHLQKSLAGPAPAPLEELLAAHVATTWLAVAHAETVAAAPGAASLGEAALRFKRAESAARRHHMAVRTLALVRAMGPAALAAPSRGAFEPT